MDESFSYRRVGTTGCEIMDHGIVIAWATNEAWAAVIMALLNEANVSFEPCLVEAARQGRVIRLSRHTDVAGKQSNPVIIERHNIMTTDM